MFRQHIKDQVAGLHAPVSSKAEVGTFGSGGLQYAIHQAVVNALQLSEYRGREDLAANDSRFHQPRR